MGINLIDKITPKNDAFQGMVDNDQIVGVEDGFLDEDNMASDSATAFASQRSIKKYVDDNVGGAPEGTAVLSTGEGGGTKFLREDGDGTSSWQTPSGSGDVVGPSSAVDNRIATFDSTTGKLIQDSGTLISAVTANTAKNTNVPTALSVGTVTSTTVSITSDSGADDVTLPAATTDDAGLLTAALFDEIDANTAKATNVSTNLSEGTSTTTTVDVNSSDGTNATLVSASTSRAGLLTKAKWDEIVANTAAKHTQGTDTALGSGAVAADHGTAATDQIVNVCYGTGAAPTASTTTEGSLYIQYTA